jgi:hypothetical protein
VNWDNEFCLFSFVDLSRDLRVNSRMDATPNSFAAALDRLGVEVEKADGQLDNLLRNVSADERIQRVREKLSKEPSLRVAIDEAVLGWAEGKPLPIVSDLNTRLLIWDRFFFAHNFGLWLFEQGLRNESKSQGDILKWLLVDCWLQVGILRWKMTLENMEKL